MKTTLVESKEIPIIDMGIKYIDDIKTFSVNQFAKELDQALVTDGIALLVNHGLDPYKSELAAKNFETFCDKPLNHRNRYKCEQVHGYIEPYQEAFNQKLKEARHTFNIANTIQAKMPEAEIPGFGANVSRAINEYNDLQRIILQALALNLNVNENWFIQNNTFIDDVDKCGTTLRLLHYPPIDSESIPADTIRCGVHPDYGTFTLLWQDSEGGLEITRPNEPGVWHRVGHVANSLIIIVGEIMEIWSEKRYPALWHRVVIPEEESIRAQGRNALIWFCVPHAECQVGPIKEISEFDNNNADGKYMKAIQFYKQRLSRIFEDGYQNLSTKI